MADRLPRRNSQQPERRCLPTGRVASPSFTVIPQDGVGALCTESVAGFDHEGKSWIALALSPHGRVPTGEFADRAVAERARNILQLAQTRDH